MDADLLLKAFAYSEDSRPLFCPASPFLSEAISFFDMAVSTQLDFLTVVSDSGLGNMFVANLLNVAQITFQKIKFSYLHSIIISIILLLVTDPAIAAGLSEAAEGGSHADHLLMVLLDLCESEESFWASFACIFNLLAANVTVFSLQTEMRVLNFFETICERQRLIVPLFMDAFVSVLAMTETPENKFLNALVERANFFDGLEAKSINVLTPLQDFLDFVSDLQAEEEELADDDLVELLDELEFADTDIPRLLRNLHTFAGEMEKTYVQWTDLLFIRSWRAELGEMQDFQAEYLPTLIGKIESVSDVAADGSGS